MERMATTLSKSSGVSGEYCFLAFCTSFHLTVPWPLLTLLLPNKKWLNVFFQSGQAGTTGTLFTVSWLEHKNFLYYLLQIKLEGNSQREKDKPVFQAAGSFTSIIGSQQLVLNRLVTQKGYEISVLGDGQNWTRCNTKQPNLPL